MVSQDTIDRLQFRSFKWFLIAIFSIVIVILATAFSEKFDDYEAIYYLIVSSFAVLALIAFIFTLFNIFVLLKVKNIIKLLHKGFYQEAKEKIIKIYKFSGYKEINNLIDYIDSQIINKEIFEEEFIDTEKTEEISERIQEINRLQEEINLRSKRLEKIKAELEQKLQNLKSELDTSKPELKEHFYDLINQYSDLMRFTQAKSEFLKELYDKLENLKQRHEYFDKIWQEREELEDFQQQLRSEGVITEEEEDDIDEIDKFFDAEQAYLEYIKEFLASERKVENYEEFIKLKRELLERLLELEQKTNVNRR